MEHVAVEVGPIVVGEHCALLERRRVTGGHPWQFAKVDARTVADLLRVSPNPAAPAGVGRLIKLGTPFTGAERSEILLVALA